MSNNELDLSKIPPFDTDKLAVVKVCKMCGRERSIKRFKSWHGKEHASPQCEACARKLRLRKTKILANNKADQVLKLFTAKVKAAKARNTPHIADLCSGVVNLMGGEQNFLQRMFAALQRAEEDGKHSVVQSYYMMIARWAESAHQGEAEDFSTLNQEELELVANQIATQAIRSELNDDDDDLDDCDKLLEHDNDDDLDGFVDPGSEP